MNILVTGALGFFGLNLVRFLAAQNGVTVIATDRRHPTAEQIRFLQPVADRVGIKSLDIQDRSAIHTLLTQQRISHIVHAAALTPTPEQEAQQPTAIVDVNLGGTINILDAASQCNALQRLILASSSGVYGASSALLGGTQPEEGPLQLNNLYSITKRSTELLLERYSQLSGISMAAVRLPPLYGPLERSSVSRPRLSAVGQLMAALQEGRALRVAGPTVSRDWTYMVDGAAAVLALLQAPQLSHAVYNVSCGVAVPWREVVAAFVAEGLSVTWVDDLGVDDLGGKDIRAADITMRPEQARLPMAITRLQEDTDFVPQYPLASGISAYRKHEVQ